MANESLEALQATLDATNVTLKNLREERNAYTNREPPYDTFAAREEYREKHEKETDKEVLRLADLKVELAGKIARQETENLQESAQALRKVNVRLSEAIEKAEGLGKILKYVNLVVTLGISVVTGNALAIAAAVTATLTELNQDGN